MFIERREYIRQETVSEEGKKEHESKLNSNYYGVHSGFNTKPSLHMQNSQGTTVEKKNA